MHRASVMIGAGLRIVVIASLLVVPMASAAPPGSKSVPYDRTDFYKAHHTQHGPSTGHLPGSKSNVELVGKLDLTAFDGDISDLSALQASNGRWYAYLGNWGAHCNTGGVHIVDITDPAKPRRVGFLNSPGTGYATEGVQALHVETTAFKGDILVVSNEWCLANPNQPGLNPKNLPGGITIYDITRPLGAKVLVEAFGDVDLHVNRANESHSAIAWNAGTRAYVAAIDNEELQDVDIFDITDPRNPVKVSETELPGVRVNAYGTDKTSHDLDVIRKPDGKWHLMVSDWDAGWIDIDVTDPQNPAIAGDFDYAECDQVVPTACPPEGNAHQGEWNADGSLFIGTDEDFSPFRLPIEITSGPLSGQIFAAGEFGWTVPVANLPDDTVNGPMMFGGYGCPDDRASIPPPSVLGPLAAGEESIIVFQRGPVNDPNHQQHGACFFSEKVESGELAGYDVVIIANHHAGAAGGALPDAFICGGQGSPVLGTAHGLCVGHRFMHQAFSRPADYTLPYPLSDPGDLEPNVGDLGPKIRASSQFDGWGYVRLFNANTMTEIDQLTIPETADLGFVTGYGDLTVHEVEVPRGDPNEGGSMPDDGKLAYFSWYSGGLRVASYTATGIVEVGHYIDPRGNNFWGVALAKDRNGNRIILASDRDFGLFIFRYTGQIP